MIDPSLAKSWDTHLHAEKVGLFSGRLRCLRECLSLVNMYSGSPAGRKGGESLASWRKDLACVSELTLQRIEAGSDVPYVSHYSEFHQSVAHSNRLLEVSMGGYVFACSGAASHSFICPALPLTCLPLHHHHHHSTMVSGLYFVGGSQAARGPC